MNDVKNKNSLAITACDGVVTVYKEELNMKIHSYFGALVLLLSWYLNISKNEWLWMLLTIFLVIVMKYGILWIENVVDLATNKEFHPLGVPKIVQQQPFLVTASFSLLLELLFLFQN